MTLSSSVSRIDYAGNGSTTIFAYPYYFLVDTDLVVIRREVATGIEIALALGTDYAVAGAGALTGGTVTLAAPPAVGETLTIRRQLALVQETDFVANDPLSAEVLERAIDRVVMALQQQDEVQARTLQFPVGDSPSLSTTLPASTVRASRSFGFNAAGEPIAVDPPVVDSTALVVVGSTAPAHQQGRFWIDTGTANTLVVKQSDGADWTELWRVDVAANAFLHQSDVTVASIDAGPAVGPSLTLDRASASPAASDLLGALAFQGRSSTGAMRGYAKLLVDVMDATNTAEDGRLLFQTIAAGTLATRMALRDRLLLSVALETAKGAAVASAATTDIWGPGDGTVLHIAGTTTITSFGTALQPGALRILVFDAALTLAHGANLILNNAGANVTTAIGDLAIVFADTTTKHYCYMLRATGNSVGAGGWAYAQSAATTSGTAVNFTGIPGGTTEIVLTFASVSQNAANAVLLLQLGDSGGLETSGYSGNVCEHIGGTGAFVFEANSSGFRLTESTNFDAAHTLDGCIRLRHLGSNGWAIEGLLGNPANLVAYSPMGIKTLSGILDRISLTTLSGTAAFDAGTLYVNAR